MRSNRDNRTDKEVEIDDFLSQFETPVDELPTNVNSYLEDAPEETNEKVDSFYGSLLGKSASQKKTEEPAPSPASAEREVVASHAEPVVEEKPTKVKKAKKEKAENADGSNMKAKASNLKEKLFLKPNMAYDPSQPDVYELNGKKIKNKPMKVSIKKIILDILALGLAMVLCFLIYFFTIVAMSPKYDFHDIYSEVDTSSMIYDDQDNLVDNVYYTQNRKVIKYEEMPEDLVNSFIAIEDKTFWKHHGFNWVRMVGAVLSSFTGSGRISGTSTITQQLARNVYLADTKSQRSIKRKLLEMYYASRIEHALTKQEIIEAYLNTIYLGYGCYGVDAAAKTYFSCEVKDLSLIQCASLAALPKMPEDYALLKYGGPNTVVSDDSKTIQEEPDLIVTNDLSKDRRNLDLGLMLDQGFITKDEYNSNVDKALNDFIKPTISSGNGNMSYFHEYLVDTIISDLMDQYGMDYSDAERMVYTKGLQIYSTLDSTAQNVVATEFKDAANFPGISALRSTDSDGNLLNNDKEIALYKYDNYFNEDGDFTLSDGAATVNSDGSVTIIKNKDLNIYTTEVNGATDYSLEFKNYYRVIDNQLYSYQGGYINVPSTYKSLDGSGNLVISADFFNDEQFAGYIKLDGDKVVITKSGYSLSSKTLQPQGAMVITEVGTGKVKAMVGGRAFNGQKLLNRALNSRQPGSSIKPLAVYGAALQKSFDLQADGKKWTFTDFGIDKQGTKGWGDYVTVHSSIEDEKTHIENRDWPDNVTKSFSGENTFKTAVQKSINTCAVKLQLQVGAAYSMNQLKKFGITTAIDDESQAANDMNPAALALGAMVQGVKPLEMSLAYAAFPGEGQVCTPVVYTKVVDRKGEVILEGKTTKTEALNSGVAWIMIDVLQSVVKANRYINLDNNVIPGGKTGTTNERYDIWFDGFTPSYSASLWIGTDQNVEMDSGSYTAARLWGKIMNQIPNALKGSYPIQPSNVVSRGGEYFTAGTETGLTKWSDKSEEEKKKDAEKKARAKWEAERESHKHWVVDQEAGETVVHHDAVTHEETVTDADGNTTTTTVVDKPAWDETVKTEEKGHWEYDAGWRDGDFKYKGN